MRRSSITSSAAFHVTIIILATVGLPFLARHEFVIPPPIVVEFVEISKVTETNKIAPQPQPAPPKPEEKPPAAAKNTANDAVVPVPKDTPKPEDKKEVKKTAKAAPEIDKNAPPDKTKKSKTEEAKKDPSKDFSSVLKNLLDTKDKPAAKGEKAEEKPSLAQNAPLGEKMTMSEEDALRTQLEKCWNVPFGAKDAENMSVDIFMVINQDRTLREARVVDQTRYNSDSFYRAAADSALRAVRNPLCSPFELPPDKYDVWNRVTVTFNPKDMF
jgi:outer membrane biosynthesis protein TonB